MRVLGAELDHEAWVALRAGVTSILSRDAETKPTRNAAAAEEAEAAEAEADGSRAHARAPAGAEDTA